MRGSPIRTSSDQRSVGSSPRLIAASYVLHRLLVPRHPPCALINLATKYFDARVHCAVLKVRAGFQTRARRVPAGAGRSTMGAVPRPVAAPGQMSGQGRGVRGVRCGVKPPVPSGPNSVPRQTVSGPNRVPCCRSSCTCGWARRGLPTGQCSTLEHHPQSERLGHGSGRATVRSPARCSLERR